ncbi:MAG: hypothetical protein ACPGRE_01380 [Flavobacteriaceae bacterium]
MKTNHKILLLGYLLFSIHTHAQQEKPKIFVKKINQNITLDGKLDEKVWSTADTAQDF